MLLVLSKMWSMLFLHNEMHRILNVVSEKQGGFQHLNSSINQSNSLFQNRIRFPFIIPPSQIQIVITI